MKLDQIRHYSFTIRKGSTLLLVDPDNPRVLEPSSSLQAGGGGNSSAFHRPLLPWRVPGGGPSVLAQQNSNLPPGSSTWASYPYRRPPRSLEVRAFLFHVGARVVF